MTWAKVVTFTVPGRPTPKARPRVVAGHTYTPAATLAAERAIGFAALAALRTRPGDVATVDRDGMFAVGCDFWGPRWTSDVDNLAKTVLDALSGVCWRDDSQVVSLTVTKHRATKDQARTVVTVWRQATEAVA